MYVYISCEISTVVKRLLVQILYVVFFCYRLQRLSVSLVIPATSLP